MNEQSSRSEMGTPGIHSVIVGRAGVGAGRQVLLCSCAARGAGSRGVRELGRAPGELTEKVHPERLWEPEGLGGGTVAVPTAVPTTGRETQVQIPLRGRKRRSGVRPVA